MLRSDSAERFRDARHGEAVAQEVIERLLRTALDGEPIEEELALFGPPRETLVIRGAPLLDDEGTLIGAAAYVKDVTELRRVEAVRRDFVANVSHELKTPIGAMGLLAETFLGADDVEVSRRLAEQLVREADRLARIVDDLLDLSTVEAQEHPTREQVRVRVLVDEAVERVRALALAGNIPLHVAPIGEDLFIACDPGQVVGAVTNLLDNAVKYSEEGRSVDISAEESDGRLVVTVCDHGIGIPSRDLERIFERFYKTDQARSSGGTGLGLSIAKHIVEAHQGRIWAESTLNQGSRFFFWIPLQNAQDQ